MKYKQSNRGEVDKNTYGSSQCAIDLAQILTDLNNKSTTKSVGKILVNFNYAMDDLSHTKNMTETFYKLWFTRCKTAIFKKNFPKDVETRVLNLITASYRKSYDLLKYNKPKYIIGCDMANGEDTHVTFGVIHKDGVIEYKINHDDV